MKSVRLQLLVTFVAAGVAGGTFAGKGPPPTESLFWASAEGNVEQVRRHLSWCSDAEGDRLEYRRYRALAVDYPAWDRDAILRHFFNAVTAFRNGETTEQEVVARVGRPDGKHQGPDGSLYFWYQVTQCSSAVVYFDRRGLYLATEICNEEGAPSYAWSIPRQW